MSKVFELFRYKREEIKIEAWESRQKAKIEAEMRRIEVFQISSASLSLLMIITLARRRKTSFGCLKTQ